MDREAGRASRARRRTAEWWRPGSVAAEAALEEASELLRVDDLTEAKFLEVKERLKAVLSDTDPFWIRWNYLADKKGFDA